MKKYIYHIAAVLSLFVMLGVAAKAQVSREMTITIPFNFYVGKTALPAGEYTVYRTASNSGDAFLLRDASGRAVILFNAQQIQSTRTHRESALDFRRYDDKSFLACVWTAGNEAGRELKPTRMEREAAQQTRNRVAQNRVTPEVITVTGE